jgi:hypothetical protein
MKARTLKQVNSAIQREIGNVTLRKGAGYFYVSSDDLAIDLELQKQYNTSIYVCSLNQQSVEAWVADVRDIVEPILWTLGFGLR